MAKKFLIGSYAPAGENSLFEMVLEGEKLTCTKAWAIVNAPSWIMMHPNGKVLYMVEESKDYGKIAVCAVEGGEIRLCAEFSTQGSHPCHIEIDPGLSQLYVSNYTSGSLAVFAIDGEGMVTGMTQLIEHSGSGKNPDRQEGPHVHSARCVGDRIYVCDLGIDRVFCYCVDPDTGKLIEKEEDSIAMPAGSGPRHTCFRDDVLYIICELTGEVYAYDMASRTMLQKAACIPENAEPGFTSAAIRMLGDQLYTSTRFTDCVAVFDLSGRKLVNGRISPDPYKAPRDICPLEGMILTADQDSYGIGVHKVVEGRLQTIDFVECGSARPTCILEV